SARAVETMEIINGETKSIKQMPTFFPRQIELVNELTRATVNVEVRDLDAKSELHKTIPVWLVPRTTAPLSVLDPSTGQWRDLTAYFAAFVTPNAPAVMEFVRNVTDAHPKKELVGYQIADTRVQPQVQATFDALKALGIRYVQSVIQFTRESGAANQRVRRPAETLKDKNANCIDSTLLMASLLEAISLNPAIVLIPGHAFLAWETWRDGNGGSDQWKYVETTMIGTATFEDACAEGEKKAADWQASAKGNPDYFRRLALSDLRAQGITPLE
ncbi:MAG TPA: hypothetical protein VNN25_17345, partial [Thermoanaerobaculia bacterium]|nr:hypothetical protein [Thermoanaerobaculia bacterium]